eukprot:gene11304-7836_t
MGRNKVCEVCFSIFCQRSDDRGVTSHPISSQQGNKGTFPPHPSEVERKGKKKTCSLYPALHRAHFRSSYFFSFFFSFFPLPLLKMAHLERNCYSPFDCSLSVCLFVFLCLFICILYTYARGLLCTGTYFSAVCCLFSSFSFL